MTATVTFPIISGQVSGFNPMPVGGGGFLTGIDFSADGSRGAICTDVGNAYVKDFGVDAKWRTLLTSASLPQADYDPRPDNYSIGLSDGDGTYAAIIDPSNKANILVGFNAYAFISHDGGLTFARCNLAAKKMLANSGEQRLWQRKFAWHPTDSNTFVIGTCGDGQYYTQNGGTSFTAIGIPAGTTLGGFATAHLAAFDPGAPLNVFISRHGTGIYRSTAGVTGAFAAIAGGPTSARYMKVMPGGTLWVCTVEGTLWKLARGSSAWTQITGMPGSLVAFTFGLDPANETRLIVMNSDGSPVQSNDAGATWIGASQWFGTFPAPIGLYQNAVDVPWLGGFSGGFFPSELNFRPGQVNQLWTAQGLGVSKSNPPATYSRWDWYDDSLGIEELGFTCGLSIPGNARSLFGCYDKGIWRPRNLDFPRDVPIFPNGGGVLQVDHCYALDYAPDDPNYVVGIVNFNNQEAGYSSDGGKTWHVFAAQHPDGAGGGCVACTGVNNIIWVPGNNGKAVRSSNGGASWSYINMAGSVGGIANWVNSIFTRRNIVSSDKQRTGYAEIVVNNSNQGITAGVYQTTDHGATWALKFSGVIDAGSDTAQFWHATLSYIPGKSGELLYTAGPTFNSLFKKSANDGVGWSTLRAGEIDHVNLFGFGLAAPAQSYPAVYFDGNVNGVSGIYRSKDFFAAAPELLARWPNNEIGARSFITGDMNKYGRLFVGIAGKGVLVGNFA